MRENADLRAENAALRAKLRTGHETFRSLAQWADSAAVETDIHDRQDR